MPWRRQKSPAALWAVAIFGDKGANRFPTRRVGGLPVVVAFSFIWLQGILFPRPTCARDARPAGKSMRTLAPLVTPFLRVQ
jgi:hypothetical protein